MSLKNPTWVGTECDLGFSPGAPGEEGERLLEGLEPGCALAGSASCWQETACAAAAATWRVGADTRSSNLGGATTGGEAAASPRLDLPFGGSETCSALADRGGVRAGLSPKGLRRSHRVGTWTGWMDLASSELRGAS